MSKVRVNEIRNYADTVTLAKLEDGQLTGALSPQTGFRNRIINGDMRIDQRNNGAAVTGSNVFSVDRFLQTNNVTGATYSVQKDSSVPNGFSASLKVTFTSSATPTGTDQVSIRQYVEGFNTADFGWGAANAQPVTLSFWVRSSVTGTFGGAFLNAAFDRVYVFEYDINSTDTWEYKTITIAGDTSGTWETGNSAGVRVYFGLGAADYTTTAGSWGSSFAVQPTGSVNLCATNGATWYVTGVQLEKGTVATPFEFRSIGQELALCQRYYYFDDTPFQVSYRSTQTITAVRLSRIYFPVSMRAAPTVSESGSGLTNSGTLLLSDLLDVTGVTPRWDETGTGRVSVTVRNLEANAEL